MSYAIRAWRGASGDTGISIGHIMPVGWDNHVAELILDEQELDGFLADCAGARQRAREAPGVLDEPMPGPYEDWERARKAGG